MDKIEKLITKYFDKTNVQINMDDVVMVLSKYTITIEELEKVLFDIKSNLSFFDNELGRSFNGIFISNLLSYAIDAIYIPENKWAGSKNRNRITKEYKLILNGDKSKIKGDNFFKILSAILLLITIILSLPQACNSIKDYKKTNDTETKTPPSNCEI